MFRPLPFFKVRTMSSSSTRYHPNPYMGKDKEFKPKSRDFIKKLTEASGTLLSQMTDNFLKNPWDDDVSVYTGMSGIILTYWLVYNSFPDLKDPRVVQIMEQYKAMALQGSKKLFKGKKFTYICGDLGPLVVGYLISTDVQERIALAQRIVAMENWICSETLGDGKPVANEILTGRAGYLYALMFLNEQFPNCPVVPVALIAKVARVIVEDGRKNRLARGPPLHYEWHDKIYLGAAHGYVGILYMLLKCITLLDSNSVSRIKDCVRRVESQSFESGNLRSSVGSNNDRLVHWCHGAPGAVFLFLEACKAFPEEKERYMATALKCGQVIWERGILKTSYSLCHGTAGNAYALFLLYKETEDELWLKRASLFAQWCFSWGKHANRQPDRPNSLFEGLAGSVYMLHDLLHFLTTDYETISECITKFPAFQLE